jgi:hypothetical protein
MMGRRISPVMARSLGAALLRWLGKVLRIDDRILDLWCSQPVQER